MRQGRMRDRCSKEACLRRRARLPGPKQRFFAWDWVPIAVRGGTLWQ